MTPTSLRNIMRFYEYSVHKDHRKDVRIVLLFQENAFSRSFFCLFFDKLRTNKQGGQVKPVSYPGYLD